MAATTNGRQGITTKYLGPTNHRGSRVKATCEAGSVTVEWDHALNSSGNHAAAASALLTKLRWAGHYVGSGIGPGAYAFAYVGPSNDGERSPAYHHD